MKLSVVILNYNVRYFLEQCILSVQRAISTIDAEIIVIDNNSKDDSCEMVRKLFPSVTLIENKDNVGFSKANNQAVEVAKGEYVCILNPDTAVEEDVFQQAINYYEKTPSIGALGVFLMDGTGGFLPESKRNLPTPKVSLLKLTGFSSEYYANDLTQISEGEVDVLVGAFMLIKREIYNEVDGFDEDYFMYGEDIDLSYKITKAGYQNHYLGSSTVLHYKGESTKKDDAYFDRFYGSMEIFYRKHFRRNRLLEGTVSIGVELAKKVNKLSSTPKPKKLASLERNLVFTKDDTLVEQLSEVMGISFQKITDNLDNVEVERSLVVFDAEHLKYKEIFHSMKKWSGKDNRFRIRPPGCKFIIGSDQSDEKGEVIVF